AGDLRPGDARAQRGPIADPLGHRDQVGRDAPVLEAPEGRPGPAESGLDLIRDAEPAVSADDLVDDLEVFARRHDGPADPLDRLGDEAGHLAGSLVADQVRDVPRTFDVAARILQAEGAAVAVAGRGVLHAFRRARLEFPRAVRGQRHRALRPAMVAVAQADD